MADWEVLVYYSDCKNNKKGTLLRKSSYNSEKINEAQTKRKNAMSLTEPLTFRKQKVCMQKKMTARLWLIPEREMN